MMQHWQIEKILREAMKYQQPKAFKEMTKDCTLDEYLSSLATNMHNEVCEARDAVVSAITMEGKPQYEPDGWKRVEKIEMAIKAAEDVALAQALEQIGA